MSARPTLKFHPGELVERKYEIRRHLGDGGMGAVYQAHHRVLGRDVAMKFIPLVIKNTSIDPAELFQREAQLQAKIKHKNIVEALDGGILEKRHPDEEPIGYIVMELVDGPSLRQAIQRGLLDRLRSLAALTQVANALVVIHGARFLHRDIKPENTLCTEDWVIKVCDYSNARFSPHSKYKTLNPNPVGTVQYMPFEQLMNSGMDETVDTYALGLMAFELLTGRHPLSATTGLLPSRQEVIRWIMKRRPMPLLAKEHAARELPSELVKIVDRATRDDVAERPQAVELHRVFRNATAEARDQRARAKAAGSVVKSPAAAAAAAAVDPRAPLPTTARGTVRIAPMESASPVAVDTEPLDMERLLGEGTPSGPVPISAPPPRPVARSASARPRGDTPARALDPTPEPLSSEPAEEARPAVRRAYPTWISIASLAGGFVVMAALCVALLFVAGAGPFRGAASGEGATPPASASVPGTASATAAASVARPVNDNAAVVAASATPSSSAGGTATAPPKPAPKPQTYAAPTSAASSAPASTPKWEPQFIE